jgi:hypothetical protein
VPDLLTHTLLNLVVPWGRLRREELGLFAFGGVLPDLVSRVPTLAMARLAQPALLSRGIDLDWLVNGFAALHLPLGYLGVVIACASALPRFLLGSLTRSRICALLLGGGALHLAVDVMQSHMRPGYRYLYPFSMRPLELGWFDADLGFLAWPVLLPLALYTWRRAAA